MNNTKSLTAITAILMAATLSAMPTTQPSAAFAYSTKKEQHEITKMVIIEMVTQLSHK